MSLPNLRPSERRRHPRWLVPDDGRHVVEMWWPSRKGHRVTTPLHDLSPAGLSFRLEEDLPGLEVCRPIRSVHVRLGALSIRADLVVIHITSTPGRPTICGTLVYPKTDDDLVALKAWLATHEAD
jgi:hypothetical protein